MADPMRYADRDIHSADIWGFNKVVVDGMDGVDTSVVVNLCAQKDPNIAGPRARFEFAFDTSFDQSFAEIEDKALEIATSFMRRLGSMTVEELKEKILAVRTGSLLAPPE